MSTSVRRAPTARAGRRAARGPISRPTFASICGLTARMTTSASATASTLDATTRIPWVAWSASRRSARGWLATTWSGRHEVAAQQPAIIASAMTPEPTVAIVRFARGDIARRITDQRATAGRLEEEPARGRDARRRRGRRGEGSPRRPLGSCHVQGMPGGGPPSASGSRSMIASRPPGAEPGAERGDAPVEAGAAHPAQQERRRTRASAGPGSGAGGAHGSATWRWAREAVGDEPLTGDGPARGRRRRRRRAPPPRRAAARRSRRRPRARRPARVRPRPSIQRVDHVQLRRPGRVVDRAPLEVAPAQEPVVGEGPDRPRRPAGVRSAHAPSARGRVAAVDAWLTLTRAASARRSRPRRNGLSPAFPRHVGHSCAQPSRSLSPRRGPGRAAPQAVERLRGRPRGRRPASRGQSARTQVAGGAMPSKAAGIEELGEDLDAVDHPGPGQRERAAVDDEHPVLADGAGAWPSPRGRVDAAQAADGRRETAARPGSRTSTSGSTSPRHPTSSVAPGSPAWPSSSQPPARRTWSGTQRPAARGGSIRVEDHDPRRLERRGRGDRRRPPGGP